jgi:hypothetical protein
MSKRRAGFAEKLSTKLLVDDDDAAGLPLPVGRYGNPRQFAASLICAEVVSLLAKRRTVRVNMKPAACVTLRRPARAFKAPSVIVFRFLGDRDG